MRNLCCRVIVLKENIIDFEGHGIQGKYNCIFDLTFQLLQSKIEESINQTQFSCPKMG